MNYQTANSNWEEFFIQEALDLEEKMQSLQFEDLQRSRLRLSLENKILNQTSHLNINSIAAGIYFIKFKLPDGSLEIKKFVKQ